MQSKKPKLPDRVPVRAPDHVRCGLCVQVDTVIVSERMPTVSRRRKALQGNDRAKKSKHEHGEPSSASSSEVAPAYARPARAVCACTQAASAHC